MREASNPFEFLTKDFSPYAAWIGSTLSSYVMPYLGSRTIPQLRGSGALSCVDVKPDYVTRPIQDQKTWEIMHTPKFFLYCAYGLAFCPEALSADQSKRLPAHIPRLYDAFQLCGSRNSHPSSVP